MSEYSPLEQAEPRLRVRGLRRPMLGPIDLDLMRGETLGIRGPSGGGKTVFLRALADLDPHEGEVLLDGVACAGFAPAQWRRQVVWVPAEPQWWELTPGQHFTREPASEILLELKLSDDLLAKPVAVLSEGQRQRLALLRALELKPKVLLLDEPTARLDLDNAKRVEAVIRRAQAETGVSVIWVSHDQEQLRRVAGRELCLDGGRLQACEDRNDTPE